MNKKCLLFAVLLSSFFRLDGCKFALCLTNLSFKREICKVLFMEQREELLLMREFSLKDLKEKLNTSPIVILHLEKPQKEIISSVALVDNNDKETGEAWFLEMHIDYESDGKVKKITLRGINENLTYNENVSLKELGSWDISCCCDQMAEGFVVRTIECDLNFDGQSTFNLGASLHSSDDNEVVREFEQLKDGEERVCSFLKSIV